MYNQNKAMSAASEKTFGDYVVLGELGKGTFGQVYLVKRADDKAADDTLAQRFALKRIPFPTSNRKREEELVDREEAILRKINHRYVVRYVDSFRDKDTVYMVMDYHDGGTLYAFIRELRHKMTEDMFLCFMEQIAHGVQYLHKNGIMHRDLKTKNILRTNANVMKICDFGISKFAGISVHSKLMGTPRYMSPEIVKEQPYEYKTDIWSLGCTSYEMALAKYAFKSDMQSEIFHDIATGKVPSCDDILYCADIKDMIKRMLDVSPSQRPSAGEILKTIGDHECTQLEPVLIPNQNGAGGESNQSTDDSTVETTASNRTNDSGLCVSGKVKNSFSKAKRCLERASTEFQTILVDMLHSRKGVDLVKDIKEAHTLDAAWQILQKGGKKKISSQIMSIVESLYNVEKELRRLDNVDATFSSLDSSTSSLSTMSRSRTLSHDCD